MIKQNMPSTRIKPKKSLGQNFLIDASILESVMQAIDPQKGEAIVEIGPGRGALTKPLVDSGANIIAIEKDESLVADLKLRLKSKKIKVIEGDALEEVKNLKLKVKSYKLVGNIPYYITGHLLRILSELKHKPSFVVLMIQKEVAERICAKNGEMNILAASIQIWAEPEIVRFVSREAFNPKPNVDSAIIKLKVKSKKMKLDNYYKLLHIVFKQPRKTLLNNLRSGGFGEEKIKAALDKLDIDVKARPQDLSIENLNTLSKSL